MAFDAVRMREANFHQLWRDELTAFIEDQQNNGGEQQWEPRLNDQDVFNAVFSRRPDLAGCFDCEWNLQYHAHMNTRRICEAAENKNSPQSGDGESAASSLNCDASQQKGLFLCRKRPKVAHFMAGSYKRGGAVYYSQFWQSYESLDMDLIAEAINYETDNMQ